MGPGIVGAIGGVAMLVGLVLPWITLAFFGDAGSVTGLQTIVDRPPDSSEYRSIVFGIAAVLTLVAGIAAGMATVASTRRSAGLITAIAGGVGAAMCAWLFIDVVNAEFQVIQPTDYFGVGFYLSAAGGVIGVVGGLLVATAGRAGPARPGGPPKVG